MEHVKGNIDSSKGVLSFNTRKKVKEWAETNNWPAPGQIYRVFYVSLIITHKTSLIMREIDEVIDRIMLLNDRIQLAIKEGNITAVVMLKDRRAEEMTKLAAYVRLLEIEAPVKCRPKKNKITDSMIQRAREYPYDQLIEVNRNRMAVCPFHGDKDPSFSIKNNHGYCFGCHWKGDPIAFVMEKNGVKFQDAVRSLQ